MMITVLAALALTAGPPRYCSLLVVRDDVTPFVGYKAALFTPGCPDGRVARVRKASTVNQYARYRPILPLVGAWELGPRRNTVPPGEVWTSDSWRWEYWDGEAWVPAEVIR